MALDDRRLQFSLHKASSVKPEDLSTMLVDSNEPERIGLRTGPFKLVSTEPMVLERFDGYYQGKPSVERVEMHEYPTHRAAWTGMMRREVNFLHEVSRDAIDFVEAGGDIRAYPLLRPYYTALVFSMRPSGAEAPRGAGRHQRGARSQRARSQCHARARADCRGPVLALSLGLSAGAFPGRVQP